MPEQINVPREEEKQPEKGPGGNEQFGEWTIIKKQYSPSSFSIVPFIHSSAEGWSVLVQRDNLTKWLSLTEEEFNPLNEGEKITLKLEQWEQPDIFKEISGKIERADSFESLAEAIKSIGDFDASSEYGDRLHCSTEKLLTLLQFLGKDNKPSFMDKLAGSYVDNLERDGALFNIPKTYGLRDKVLELLANKDGKGVAYIPGRGLEIDPEIKSPQKHSL